MGPELRTHLKFMPRRQNPSDADGAFSRLGVVPQACFFEYCRTYVGPVGSDYTGLILSDLIEEQSSIEKSTVACRKHHGFRVHHLVISDLCGGAVLVYDCNTDAVLNVDFEGGQDRLFQGTINPQWLTFESFLEFFFLGKTTGEATERPSEQ
jgi:hypothetical protein